MTYPWQQEIWARLQTQRQQDRLPHALLIAGPVGIGKRDLAAQLQAALLCQTPTEEGHACGDCERCRLLAAGSHPDVRAVRPEEDSKVLKVDQIRAFTAFLALTSQFSGWKVGVIDPADWMNENASNALLKTLEEPGKDTLMILVSDRPASLSATIQSRCQRIDCRLPDRDSSTRWLKQFATEAQARMALQRSAGVPLPALRILQGDGDTARTTAFTEWADLMKGKANPVDVATAWVKQGTAEMLHWLLEWVDDQIKLSQGLSADTVRNPDLASEPLLAHLSLKALYRKRDHIEEACRLAQTPVNAQSLLESVLFDWYRISRPQRP